MYDIRGVGRKYSKMGAGGVLNGNLQKKVLNILVSYLPLYTYH